jgi:D-threo-aldose 1-dehydrogenase
MSFSLPKVMLGTSSLGNLYTELPFETKLQIVKAFIDHSPGQVMFDSAGKYGAGLALETLGKCLAQLNVPPEKVMISNKLGWLRTELKGEEPTFEPGVWKNLQYDAVQKLSYDGILECYEQGNDLLGAYRAQFLSVHDPDEYIAAAANDVEGEQRYADVLEAYQALNDLKREGKVQAIGIGSKDWRTIEKVSKDVQLDWVMFANSMTLHSHPADLTAFMKELSNEGVTIINSAVFNGGFLTGSDYYNYKPVDKSTPEGAALYQWRERFFALCEKHGIKPATACVQFGLQAPGVQSIALNTSRPERMAETVQTAYTQLPEDFWADMRSEGLLD